MADDDDAIARLRVAAAERTLRAVNVSAEDLAGRAQRIAPKDEGTLRASAAVTLIVNGSRHEGEGAYASALEHVRALARRGADLAIDGEVSFNTIYAARQHEETDWHHEIGQAKYLEQPFREQLGRYQRLIEAAGRPDSM